MSQELEEREKVLRERERLVEERDGLETKRLESSRAASRQLERVSVELQTVESSLRLSRGSRKRGGESGRSQEAWLSGKEDMQKLVGQRWDVVLVKCLSSD